MEICFATSSCQSTLCDDDSLLKDALEMRGVQVHVVVWSETSPETLRGKGLLVRSCWDYSRHPNRFLSWLQSANEYVDWMGNSLALIANNIDKKYLFSLRDQGVSIPFSLSGEDSRLSSLPPEELFVIKPCVSASGRDIHVTRGRDCLQVIKTLKKNAPDCTLLIQEFLPQVHTVGERSLVYFNGNYSHAVTKKAGRDDFRVQARWGGTAYAETAIDDEVNWGAYVISQLDEIPLYARVDFISSPKTPLLIELELIEPYLFFGFEPSSAMLFADQILSRFY